MKPYAEILMDARFLADQIRNENTDLRATDARDRAILFLAEDSGRFAALLSLLLEFEEDLVASVSDYARTPEEHAMDAGGLATVRKLRAAIEHILLPQPKEKKAEEPPFVNPDKEKKE